MVDLQSDPSFQALHVELLNIALDPPSAWRAEGTPLGITTPMLSDQGAKVSSLYGVMRWKMSTGEPGHTFVLIDKIGKIAWIRDYGGMQHGGLMYVPPQQIATQVKDELSN